MLHQAITGRLAKQAVHLLALCLKTAELDFKSIHYNKKRDKYGAPGQTRTDTPARASDFESDASTNSTTGARNRILGIAKSRSITS